MTNIKIKIFLLIFPLLVVGILYLPNFSVAENQIPVQESDINYETVPSNPQPYSDITINLSSYATDLSKAIISWQSDANATISEIGKTSYTLKAKGPNDAITINITIKPVGSMGTVSKQIVIIPNEVELIWESVDGYAPPFYKGKVLPVSGSSIKVVAIPNTNTIKYGNGNVSYSWSNGDSANPDASGYNKNYFIFKNSKFDNLNSISVVASSVTENYQAQNTVEIPIYTPKIIFYKKSANEGYLFNNAITDNSLVSDEEITIDAEPYFLSINNITSDNFTYSWRINGEGVQTPPQKSEVTLRPTSRGGYATIGLTVENVNELFQTATNQIKINL